MSKEIACKLGVEVKAEDKDGTLFDWFPVERWRSTAPHFHLRFPISQEVYVPPDLNDYKYFLEE
jgi:hypothetical protein